jgi:four helix bundle protein
MAVSSYRDLTVWQKGMELTKEVYQVTQGFPKQEIYGLTSQVRRAAVSVPANIAEGHARDSTKEYLHHLSIARGSLAEVETLLLLANQLRYCEAVKTCAIESLCAEVGRMLSGLKNRLEQRLEMRS